ncbi:DNA polymerase III subunit delta [Campylobacter sp. MIT 97-5078]|uniref:DNA polymerase III subunit delta n=1 Tax=Campylobacter sp. MIT 97-5078 TaxID=1548153 RepID=UPI0005135D10|nr:DNA polymerase III subunit delta [Campylobacter sp. MIT 97-5078]KGI55395.1 DNA polymerase III subunit delta [Campylobacter sp. MIT 97-5078]TQR27950.1 hypothetical protein DMB91_01575 [Campylobacter sp. MIT 97-5078]
MYRKDLQNLLKGNYFPHFFALYGADDFQTELFASFIKEKFGVDECLKLYFEEYDFARASDYLASTSLFSEKKLLELKCFKKPSKKELEALISLCKQSEDNFFLFELYDESSKQNELEKSFENNFARFFKPNSAKEGIELLSLKAKELDINATHNALLFLYQNFDENLYLASSELNKFAGLSIDENMVEKYCFSLSVLGFESFFEQLLQGKDLRVELEKFLENFNEIALLNSLSSNFYRLFKINLYAKIHGKVDLKELLGYVPPPNVASKLQTQAFALSLAQYQKIFFLCLQSEYELKTNSKLTKKEFLISTLLELSQILKNKKEFK